MCMYIVVHTYATVQIIGSYRQASALVSNNKYHIFEADTYICIIETPTALHARTKYHEM